MSVHRAFGETGKTACGMDSFYMDRDRFTHLWSETTCGPCRLERTAETPSEHRTPSDVLARDAALSQGDARLRRLRAALAETEEVERAALRQIAELRAVVTDAHALGERLTGLIERVSVQESVSRGAAPMEPAQARTEALSAFHAFEVGAGGTGFACTAMITLPDGTADQCGRSVEAAVHASQVRSGDFVKLPAPYGQGRRHKVEMVRDGMVSVILGGQWKWFARDSVKPWTCAPVNAVDIRTDVEETGDMPKMTNLSDAAVRLLLTAPGNRIGARVALAHNASAPLHELRNAGLISPGGGLTRKGSIERERRDNASLDALFGPE